MTEARSNYLRLVARIGRSLEIESPFALALADLDVHLDHIIDDVNFCRNVDRN